MVSKAGTPNSLAVSGLFGIRVVETDQVVSVGQEPDAFEVDFAEVASSKDADVEHGMQVGAAKLAEYGC